MKDIEPVTREDTNDDADPWVKEGLRALREQMPSDQSRRATLAQFGLNDAPTLRQPAAPAAATTGGNLLRWLITGALLGVLALAVRYWLG
jgi:lysophospholipase L1-like esterase